ncbi:MAG: bacteriohemerythrin [Burkholderiales bacterium]|nr:bacteriohemerythrin [Burkholderiales bacterium]
MEKGEAGSAERVFIFPWNDNFDTGIAVIDAQHRKLVDLLNILVSHMTQGTDTPAVDAVFEELTAYVHRHFEDEEAIWRKHLAGDEILKNHEYAHRQFAEDIAGLQGSGLSQNEVMDEIASFLTHWLAFHILEFDKRMAKVVLGVMQGLSLEEAKAKANEEMSGAMRVLIETILRMYDSLSVRTLELMREISKRQRVEEKLRLAGNVIESTIEAVFVTDRQGILIDANPSFLRQTGLEEVVGKNVNILTSGFFDIGRQIWEKAESEGHYTGEVWGRMPSGESEPVWMTLSAVRDAGGGIAHFVGIFSSVSELIGRQRNLEDAANHDMLTGLPNRRLLADRMGRAIARSERSQNRFAICYMDLDGFKGVNDTFGHAAGDELLQEVARRLTSCVRSMDTVARLAGDEFVVLLEDIPEMTDCDFLLQRILEEIARPYQVKGGNPKISASIGVTIHPDDDSSSPLLLEHADRALYSVKSSGGNGFEYY